MPPDPLSSARLSRDRLSSASTLKAECLKCLNHCIGNRFSAVTFVSHEGLKEDVMTEERITETTTPSGNTHTTHTVVTDDRRSGSGGSGKVILLILLVGLAAVAAWFFSQQNASEIARDNAVAEAADSVGEAAGQVGDAAQNAGDAINDATGQ